MKKAGPKTFVRKKMLWYPTSGLSVPSFSALGPCARKPGLCPGGIAGVLCAYRSGGFPGDFRERIKKE